MTDIFFEKICIVGVGLIGGSLAKSLKQEKLAGKITGYGRSEERLELARNLGVIDDYTLDLKDAVLDSDLVVLATPIKEMPPIATIISPFLGKHTIVTDVGSVKGWVVEQLERILPQKNHFVPAHPIAGSEKSGVQFAREDLFRGAKCVLTPSNNTDQRAMEIVEEVWKRTGTITIKMTPAEHDNLMAAVSHLPHVIAYALVGTVGSSAIDLCGGGFLDTTRIALSDPVLWRDICLINKKMLINHLDSFVGSLNKIRQCLIEENQEQLESEFQAARTIRNKVKSARE